MHLGGPLRLRHLEVLHAIMAKGSVTGAAELLGTSQPTVSRDLAELEKALGMSLFVREGRRVRPSREAEFLHAEIAHNYMCVADLLELARQTGRGDAGHLRVASVPSLALDVLPGTIAELARSRPGCRFDLEVHGRDTIAGMMQEHRFDVVFTVVGGPAAKGMTIEPIATIRAVCVMPRDCPLAKKPMVTAHDLAEYPFISLAPNYISRERVDEAFRHAGVSPRIFMTTQTAISACSVIRAGHGVAVLDPLTASHALDAGLCVRQFEPEVNFDYVAAFPHRGLAGPLVRTAIEEVRERVAAVTQKMVGSLTA